jgi:hypothetical protein
MRRALIVLRAPGVLCVLCALCALLLLAACRPSTSSPPSAAQRAPTTAAHASSATARTLGSVCTNLVTITQALTPLTTITASTPVGQVQTMQSALTSAVNRLVALLPNNELPTLAELQAASTQLETTLTSQPATATMGQTGIDVNHFKSQAAALQSTVAQTASGLNCPA